MSKNDSRTGYNNFGKTKKRYFNVYFMCMTKIVKKIEDHDLKMSAKKTWIDSSHLPWIPKW